MAASLKVAVATLAVQPDNPVALFDCYKDPREGAQLMGHCYCMLLGQAITPHRDTQRVFGTRSCSTVSHPGEVSVAGCLNPVRSRLSGACAAILLSRHRNKATADHIWGQPLWQELIHRRHLPRPAACLLCVCICYWCECTHALGAAQQSQQTSAPHSLTRLCDDSCAILRMKPWSMSCLQ